MGKTDNEVNKISADINQETLEELASLFGLCLYKIDLKTGNIKLNLNTTKIAGYDYDDLPTTDGTKGSMIFREDIGLVSNSIRSVVSGQKDYYHIEYRMNRKDSSIVWVEEVGLVSGRDENGQPLFVSAMAADLSRLKWAETKARDMEAEVKKLSIERNIGSLADENRLLRASNAAASMIIGGFHQEYEVLLRQSIQMLGESLQADYFCIFRNVNSEGEAHFFLRTYWTSGSQSFKTGNTNKYFKYKNLSSELKKNFEMGNRFIINYGDVPQQFIEEFHIPNVENILFIPIQMHGEFWGTVGVARKNNIPFQDYEVSAMMTGVVIIASSVSRNETLGKINSDRDKAIANTLAKGEFLSRMTHELRTPLNAIIGMINIALREKDPQKAMGHIRKAEASSQHLLNVINDILDMSKIDAGKLETMREPFDFNAMLKTAENIIRVKTDEKQQTFTAKFVDDLMYKIKSDEHRLLQVIVNLLGNAMKFTPEGGNISLSATQEVIDENRVKIFVEVKDNGIGMTLEQQKKLFQAFEQADGSITRKYGGTGLGLAICKKILNLLDGDIWVKSKPNQGSCFYFAIEAELGEPLSLTSGQVSDNQNNSVMDWKKHTIILAEDVDINREIVEIMLAETGVKIENVANGKDAVDKFSENPTRYSLILMDVQMPIMDGLTATEYIRANAHPYSKSIPIIAMTANAFKEDVEICKKSGMNEHIAKPIVIDHFFNVLRKYLK